MPATSASVLHHADTNLGSALSLKGAGVVEVLRLTRLVKGAGDVLRFIGTPASSGSSATRLEVSFLTAASIPAPELDPVDGIIRMFFPADERGKVERMLRNKRRRFCYFWRSHDNALRQAWFVTSA